MTPIDYMTDADSWLDMDVGDHAIVLAHIESAGGGPGGSIMVSFADWSNLVIHSDNAALIFPLLKQGLVRIKVERTEDGLEAIAAWREGGAPIPLRS